MSSEKPIFISFAPEDAAVAKRVAEALRESGIEARVEDSPGVDLKAEIQASALFLPIMSRNAALHTKGNFLNEWEIAAKHMESLPRGVPFLLPIIVDETEEYGMEAPAAFGGVHWIRQPDGETTPDLIEEVVRLLTIPRGPVYFPPIPPGLSRPPFSMKKKSSNSESTSAKPKWLFPAVGGGALLIFVVAGMLMFSGSDEPSPGPAVGSTEVSTVDEPSTPEVTPEPEPEAEPEPLTDEELFAAYEDSWLRHDYATAASQLEEYLERQLSPTLDHRLELAWVKFARDLEPELYLAELTQILPADATTGESRLTPLAYGMRRDFANQRRAIREGAGRLRIAFDADPTGQEIALTESYMDQGNWTLARHYGNQARSALAETLSPAAVGPLVNGQFEAFLLMTRRDPAALENLESLATEFEEGRPKTNLLLIRALIDQGQLDRAMDLVYAGLTEPSLLDPATVLFLPPFDQLHSHPAFRGGIEALVGSEKMAAAMAWLEQEKQRGRPVVY